MNPYYQEDGIELYLGDCLEIMKNIPDKSVDMILCDLPYGTTACKWDTIIPFEPLCKECHMKHHGLNTQESLF